MRTRFGTSIVLALVLGVVATLAIAGIVAAAPTTLSATLAGVTEGAQPGDPDGSGSATVTLDPAAGTACWNMSASGIGHVNQSHIHVGAAGTSGDVVVPLDVDGFDATTEGCTSNVAANTLQGIIDNPAGFYVNLHTTEFPAGAIRGQLAAGSPNTAMPVSASDSAPVLLGALLVALVLGMGLRTWRPIATRD
jgi:CHRD domain